MIFSRCSYRAGFFVSFLLLAYGDSNGQAGQLSLKELGAAIASQREGGYVKEEKKVQSVGEGIRNPLFFEDSIDLPKLDGRSISRLLLYQVFGTRNRAIQDFLKEKRTHGLSVMTPATWEHLNLFSGRPGTLTSHLLTEYLPSDVPQIVQVAMAFRLVSPITHIPSLKGEQAIIKTLVKHPDRDHLKSQLYQLKDIEGSLLSLYNKEDNLWSGDYRKSLNRLYYNTQGRFTDWLWIEAGKRLKCECFITVGIVLSLFFSLYGMMVAMDGLVFIFSFGILEKKDYGIFAPLFESKNSLICFLREYLFISLSLFFGVLSFVGIFFSEKYKADSDYISRRLADVQRLFEVAREVDRYVYSSPELSPLREKLKCTHKLLAFRHEKPAYNELARIFLTHDFRRWSLCLNSIATLLTTLTALETYIHMLDEVLFELGHVATYFCLAELIIGCKDRQQGFAYVDFLSDAEGEEGFVDLQGVWSTEAVYEEAASNDVSLDGERKTLVIMGPNGYDKRAITVAVCRAVLVAQTLGIAPAKGGRITPFGLLAVFRREKEDAAIADVSLLDRELQMVKGHDQLLAACHQRGQKAFVCYEDSFLALPGSLVRASIRSWLAVYPGNVHILATDDLPFVNCLRGEKCVRIMYIGGAPRLTLQEGMTEELALQRYREVVGEGKKGGE